MKKIICGKCRENFEPKSITSFGFCHACFESNADEISFLEKVKRLLGAFSAVSFFVLLMMVVVPLLVGPNDSGKYVIKGSRGSRDSYADFSELMFIGMIILTISLVLLSAYYYFRRKLSIKDAEAYPITDRAASKGLSIFSEPD